MRYGEEKISKAKLESWPNKNRKRDYVIEIILPEFTCLCPRSGYPDFAAIRIKYIPGRKVVELRSLKLYINKFRGVYISHEDATNKILDELVKLLQPKWMEVAGDFNARGNVKTLITARYARKGEKRWKANIDGKTPEL
jgi:7-cyano-7-deazaguanine reductase